MQDVCDVWYHRYYVYRYLYFRGSLVDPSMKSCPSHSQSHSVLYQVSGIMVLLIVNVRLVPWYVPMLCRSLWPRDDDSSWLMTITTMTTECWYKSGRTQWACWASMGRERLHVKNAHTHSSNSIGSSSGGSSNNTYKNVTIHTRATEVRTYVKG